MKSTDQMNEYEYALYLFLQQKKRDALQKKEKRAKERK